MEVNSISLQQLQLIRRFNSPVKAVQLISRLLGYITRETFDEALNVLAVKQLITLDEEQYVTITEKGKQFMNDFDRHGEEFVFEGEYQFAVLQFLHDLDDWIKPDDFPKILLSHAPPKKGYSEGYNLMNYLEFDPEMKSYVAKQYQYYKLSDIGQSKYKYLAKRLLPAEGTKPVMVAPSFTISTITTIASQPMPEKITRSSRPLVFIGSSVESLDILNAIVSNLEFVCEFVTWDAGTFGASEYPLESLQKALVEKRPDFAIFILSGDDKLESRYVEYRTPRDNVIFELGLAIGSISRHRVFMITDRDMKIKIPSDLFGVNPVEFDMPLRGTMVNALKPACIKLKAKIEELGLFTNEKAEDKKNDLERYKDLARQYDDINIADEAQRVKKKEELGTSLGEYIARHELVRSDVANLYSEGALVGLLYFIITNPIETDPALLLKIHTRLNHPFSWFLLVDAVSILLRKKLIIDRDRDAFLELLKELYQKDHTKLRQKIASIWSEMKSFGAIQYLSANTGNLLPNGKIKVASGEPKLSVVQGPILGTFFSVEGPYPETAIDIPIDFNGQQVNTLSYTYWTDTEILFYAWITVHDSKKGYQNVWLAFKTNIITAIPEDYAGEVSIPVVTKEDLPNWRRVDINLRESAQMAYGALNYTYYNIVSVRIRGAGKIADIIVR